MGLVSRVKARNSDAIIVKFLAFLQGVCPIPPNPRVRAMPDARVLASAVAATVFLASGLATVLPPLFAPTVIDEDFILPRRLSPEGYGGGSRFTMGGNEKLVIRDCTIYTKGVGYAPSGVDASEAAISIDLLSSANLTLINVRFSPSIDIYVSGNASLKMVNVTNWDIAWLMHSSDHYPRPGLVSAYYHGVVVVSENPKVEGYPKAWVEASRIGGVQKGGVPSKGSKIAVINSWLADSQPSIWLQGNATLNKTVLKWGEPLSVAFSLKNVGEATINFSSLDKDRFRITPINSEANADGYHAIYSYDPTLPAFQLPAQLRPGEVITQTLTLRDDGSTPLRVSFQKGPTMLNRTNTWVNALPPGNYSLSAQFASRSLNLSFVCYGSSRITITDEKWQG